MQNKDDVVRKKWDTLTEKLEEQRHAVVSHEDGGHNIVSCSDCRNKLIDIWITKPELNNKNTITATCPFCNSHSFSFECKGGLYLGRTEDTEIVDIETDVNDENGILRNTMIVKTQKGNGQWEK